MITKDNTIKITEDEDKKQVADQKRADDKKIFDDAIRILITERVKDGQKITNKIYEDYKTDEKKEWLIQTPFFAEYLTNYISERRSTIVTEINLLSIDGLGRVGRFKENPKELDGNIIEMYPSLIEQKKDKFRFLKLFLPKT